MSTDRKTILFVCKFLPYPSKSGATLRNWEIIQRLSQTHKITLAALSYPCWQEDNLHLYRYVEEILTSAWTPRNYLNILQSYCRGLPLTIARFSAPSLKEQIQRWQDKNNFYQVHLSELASAAFLPEQSVITVYDAHNIESDLYRKAGEFSSRLLRQLWRFEIAKVACFEKKVINKSKKVTCVSQEDSGKIKQFLDGVIDKNRVIVLPNGTNIPNTFIRRPEKFNLLFVGQSGWHANHYSLCWFITSVWIKVKVIFPNAQLTIIGGKPKKSLTKLIRSYEDIYLYENVGSVEPYLKLASIAISPLLYGGGTSLKILEYAAYRVPIVCTSNAIRGLPFDNKHVWLCETADDFIRSFREVWSGSSESLQKVNFSYGIVETTFSWNITLSNLTGNDENSCAYPFSTK
jgi:polysaccharide biosynthesis protein PslH